MTSITFDVPQDVFSALKTSPDEFAAELRLAAAIFWYQKGQISQEKAAQVAGLDRNWPGSIPMLEVKRLLMI
ncbi:uncharacterized protein XM38_006830 [Halomicronema hongdechloris C2206]|uniref:Uncharacterized protein n=1 Tax=Halomicronema hongdechloris C2206 TaxID=1641165 RepID=A0A1Z3HHI4_9CYAN|nr:UPF0175 family protein [Halomicronema hongdechloris]ASC69754.1 uncharacterized protein XM38_006830 [Halomicronema hongdechloris C2206]